MGLSDKKMCYIVSGKRDVSRVTLQEFNINYRFTWDIQTFRVTVA